MDNRLRRTELPELMASCCCCPLFIVYSVLLIVVPATRAAESLPAVTVTGVTPTPAPRGDAVSRDWAERSPEVNWPTPMFNKAAEIFAHNQIVINASCATVWDHLVHAELWPHWCAYSGKVRIWGGAQVLQKNTKFTWVSEDVPQQLGLGFSLAQAQNVDALVVECEPPHRLGFRSYGRAWTERGPLIASYHNWYIKPLGPKKCLVTFEEVATGRAARFARMAYPEVAHNSHDEWLQGLKRISEARK
jgi:uncharacterized protein YndB with AHSA1/START domain